MSDTGWLYGNEPVLVLSREGEGDEEVVTVVRLGPSEQVNGTDLAAEYTGDKVVPQEEAKTDQQRIALLEKQLAELRGPSSAETPVGSVSNTVTSGTTG